MMKLVIAGSGLVMRRSSVITGKPFTPLLGAVSVTAPVTMVSWPALPATQPPTTALVFALVIASTSEQLTPVVIVAALAAPTAPAAPPQAKAKARTTLVLVIAASLPTTGESVVACLCAHLGPRFARSWIMRRSSGSGKAARVGASPEVAPSRLRPRGVM